MIFVVVSLLFYVLLFIIHNSKVLMSTIGLHFKFSTISKRRPRPPRKLSWSQEHSAFSRVQVRRCCGKIYYSMAAWVHHVITIHGRRDCTYCIRAMDKPFMLIRHIRTHTGEKPFVCSYTQCGKRFAARGNLRRHVKNVHERAKSYGCRICGVQMSRLKHLLEHAKMFHPHYVSIVESFRGKGGGII